MAVTIRVPDGDGTTTDIPTLFPTGGTHASKVDEGVPGNDGTDFVESQANGEVVDFLTLEAMPSDFDTANDFFCRQRLNVSGRVDDTVNVRSLIYESNETSAVGGSQTQAGNTSGWETFAASSATSDSANKATWDTRKIRIQMFRNNSGMPDAITMLSTAVEVEIDYNVAAAATAPYYFRRMMGG